MTTTRLVVKRDRSEQDFDVSRIYNAIMGAFLDINKTVSIESVNEVADYVYDVLDGIPEETIDIERIQKLIQTALMHKGYFDEAESFILYRKKRADVRSQKHKILGKDSLDELDKTLSINQLRVLGERYLLRDLATNKLNESPSQLFNRVATLVGLSDLLHDPKLFDKPKIEEPIIRELYRPDIVPYEDYRGILSSRNINEHHFERFVNLYNQLNINGHMIYTLKYLMDFYFKDLFDSKYAAKIQEYENLMRNCEFMPNTPTLMNAGTSNGGLSACFVLEALDSIDSYIRKTVGDASAVYKGAGGIGINYSNFRPAGSIANGVPNAASGPVSFMGMIDELTEEIKAGGKRRGANMAILDVNHPDIQQFITMKSKPGILENFNVSVGILDDYWQALTSGNSEYQLSHKTHHEMDKKVNPQHLWDLIALSAWKSAEPGVIFFDNINRINHMKEDLGPLQATNPCGEQPLYPNGSCTLGSINISKCVNKEGKFDWLKFFAIARQTTRLLDNVVSMNKYPTKAIQEMAFNERRIGLGVMGVADALFMMKIPYNSKEGFEFMYRICRQLTSISICESIELAKERGPAPYFNYETQGKDINTKRTLGSLDIMSETEREIKEYGIRNTWNTTIAPTGTIAMISDCSYGIEPVFALVFEKKVTIGRFFYTNEIFASALKGEGLYSDEMLAKIADNGGSIQAIEEIPEWMKRVFVTSMDIHWADHVMAQRCQIYIDNAISKTINMSKDVLVDDIKNAYLLAHEVGCKGVTVYRDGSRNEQVLHTNSEVTGKQLQPSQYTFNYIMNEVKNSYAKEKLCSFFGLPFTVVSEDFQGGKFYIDGVEHNRTVTVSINNLELRNSGTVHYSNKETCNTCGLKLRFVEGCKVCPNCQASYCNV